MPEYASSSDTESDSELWDSILSNMRPIVCGGKFLFL